MQVKFAHICDYASVSADGKLSVCGIFDVIHAAEFPVVHPTMYLAFDILLHKVETGKAFNLSVQMIDEDGKPVFGIAGDATVDGSNGRPGEQVHFRQVAALQGVKFEHAGGYELVISLNGNVASQLPFRVEQLTPA